MNTMSSGILKERPINEGKPTETAAHFYRLGNDGIRQVESMSDPLNAPRQWTAHAARILAEIH